MLPFALWNSWTDAVPGPVLIALLVGLAFAIFYDNDLFGLLISFLVAVAALLVIQRVIPPSRVFLFAAPIVALCASSGLLHLIGRWWGDLRFAIVRVAAVALAAWMALAVVRSESVIASEETGSFQDITEVMNFLNGVATPDDLVLMVLPVDQPFRYYLQLHKTDWEPVYLLPHVKDHDEEGPDERPSGKLFIVLRDHHGPIPSREQQPMTLDRISQFYRGRSEQNPVFRGPYSSVYTADGATVERGFCEVFCFRRTRIAR